MDKLEQLTVLSRMLIDAGKKRDEAESAMKLAKENERRLREEAIPLMMLEIGIKSIKLNDGSTVEASTEIYASIPQAKKQQAFKWLEENNFSGLIKTQVEINFPRGEHEIAKKWLHFLKVNKEMDAEMSETIHPMTLKAFIKEQIKDGTPIPLELFGAMVVDTTKVKLPK
jgi:hypothetical protein